MSSQDIKALLALDGSEQSRALVDYMGNVLPPTVTKIDILNIRKKQPHSFWDFDHDADRTKDEKISMDWEITQKNAIESFMNDCREILVRHGFPKNSINIIIKNREHGIATDIQNIAGDGYKLVVVGRWGHSAVAELVFGSVTHRLLEKIKDRTLCIVAGNPVNSKLLLAIDATESSQKAIRFASDFARNNNKIEIEIFHAIRHLKLPPYVENMPEVVDGEKRFIQEEREFINPIIENTRSFLLENGLDEKKLKVKIVSGVASRAEAIVKEARDNGFDGIVLGRRRQTRAEEFFVGKVGDKVFQLARKRAIFIVS